MPLIICPGLRPRQRAPAKLVYYGRVEAADVIIHDVASMRVTGPYRGTQHTSDTMICDGTAVPYFQGLSGILEANRLRMD